MCRQEKALALLRLDAACGIFPYQRKMRDYTEKEKARATRNRKNRKPGSMEYQRDKYRASPWSPKGRRDHWTPTEWVVLIAGKRRGLSEREIALALGRSVQGVQKKLLNWRLKGGLAYSPPWGAEYWDFTVQEASLSDIATPS